MRSSSSDFWFSTGFAVIMKNVLVPLWTRSRLLHISPKNVTFQYLLLFIHKIISRSLSVFPPFYSYVLTIHTRSTLYSPYTLNSNMYIVLTINTHSNMYIVHNIHTYSNMYIVTTHSQFHIQCIHYAHS